MSTFRFWVPLLGLTMVASSAHSAGHEGKECTTNPACQKGDPIGGQLPIDRHSTSGNSPNGETRFGRKLAETSQTALTSPPPPQAPPPVPTPAASASQPVGVFHQPVPPASTSSADSLGMAGVVTGAVGVGALVTGLLLNLKANSMIDDVQKRYDGGKYSSSKDYKTSSKIAYAAGGVGAVSGLVLIYFAVFAGHAAVTPVAVQGGAGAMLTGAFQ